MPEESTRGLMFSALHRFNNALENLDSFRKEKDLIDNVGFLDDFFSNFRSTTFVLQKSLANTPYIKTYEELRDKYFKNDLGKWFVETRNEIEKQHPFELIKKLLITVYKPQTAIVFKSELLSIENDLPYKSLITGLKNVLKATGFIEVHCSIEFIFTKAGENHDLYEELIGGIISMVHFLKDLYSAIDSPTELCDQLMSKIEKASFYHVPKDYLLIDDCVYYSEKDVFEIADRGTFILPPKPVHMSELLKPFYHSGIVTDSKEFLKGIVKLHCIIYTKQNNEILPTFFIVDNDDNCTIDSYYSTIRTTTYRKINELAHRVLAGNIKHITLVHEAYVYKDFSSFNESYVDRIKHRSGEVLMFSQIGKYFKYRSYDLDVARINDKDYVKQVLKQRPEENGVVEQSFFFPLFMAFNELKKNHSS